MIAGLAVSGITLLLFMPLAKFDPREEIRIAPKTAEPKVCPKDLRVLLTPDASPDCSTETAERVKFVAWPKINPMPNPNKANPGAKAHWFAPKCKLWRKTIKLSRLIIIPAWIIRLGVIYLPKKLDNGAETKINAVMGTMARPVSIGLSLSTDWR